MASFRTRTASVVLVAIPSGRLHLYCRGEGETTVVLVAGFNDDGQTWSSVTPALAASTRVCWDSRFGAGEGDQPSDLPTFSSQARDLDDGTKAAGDLERSCDAAADPFRNPEHLDGAAAFTGVAAISSLGVLPVTVLTASEHPFPGLAPAEEARLNDVWDAGQDRRASLSTTQELIRVDQTGHYIQLDQPDAVIEQIRRLLP